MTPEIASNWIWWDLSPRWRPCSDRSITEVVPFLSHELHAWIKWVISIGLDRICIYKVARE